MGDFTCKRGDQHVILPYKAQIAKDTKEDFPSPVGTVLEQLACSIEGWTIHWIPK